MISNKCRVPFINFFNRFQTFYLKFKKSNIYRYKKSFLHSKVYWNKEEIIIGSSNFTGYLPINSFELNIQFKNKKLCEELTKNFNYQKKYC